MFEFHLRLTRVCRAVLILFSCLAVAAADVRADQPLVTPLPITVADSVWQPLPSRVDEKLQKALRSRLRLDPEWRRLMNENRLAVGLVDLTDVERPRFARVNGDVMMYAASLPKLAILVAAMQAFEDGRLVETPELTQQLNEMVRVSNNAAATQMMELLGLDYIEEVLADPSLHLYDPHDGGFWVGKPYARGTPRRGDPIHGLVHATTVTQTCRLYYLLATGRLINPERSRQMLSVMVDPGLHHKFVRSIERRSPGARLFRKSGTWRTWHSDSVLVWGPEWRRYILVALVESKSGERIIQGLVEAAEDVIAP